MYNFEQYNVFLAIATNILQRLNTAFVLQGHVCLLWQLAEINTIISSNAFFLNGFSFN